MSNKVAYQLFVLLKLFSCLMFLVVQCGSLQVMLGEHKQTDASVMKSSGLTEAPSLLCFRSVSPRDPTECQSREPDGSPRRHGECPGPVGGPQRERPRGPPLQGDLDPSRNTPTQPEPGRTGHRWGKPS